MTAAIKPPLNADDDIAFVESMRAIVAHLDHLGEFALKQAVEEDLQRDRELAAMLTAEQPSPQLTPLSGERPQLPTKAARMAKAGDVAARALRERKRRA